MEGEKSSGGNANRRETPCEAGGASEVTPTFPLSQAIVSLWLGRGLKKDGVPPSDQSHSCTPFFLSFTSHAYPSLHLSEQQQQLMDRSGREG